MTETTNDIDEALIHIVEGEPGWTAVGPQDWGEPGDANLLFYDENFGEHTICSIEIQVDRHPFVAKQPGLHVDAGIELTYEAAGRLLEALRAARDRVRRNNPEMMG